MRILDLPIKISLELIQEFCQRHKIRRLSLFGSVLRKDFTLESDIDVLVEFIPGQAPGFFVLSEMEQELTQQLQYKVDLRTPAELSQYIRDRVLEEALQLYDCD
jgi:uncharacterized protein